jgi:hypothetical protein
MTDYAALMEPVARHLLGDPNIHMSNKTELRFGTNGSVKVDLTIGTWYDFEIEEGGGVIDLIRRELPGEDPIGWLRREGYFDGAGETRTVYFVYEDERRIPLYRVVRIEDAATGKKTRMPWQERADGRGGWLKGKGIMKDVRRVLYRLPELVEAPPGAAVWIPEGEGKVELLRSRGLVATCNPGGAGKWLEGFAHLFKERVVYILPDNDEQARNKKTGDLLFHPDGRPKITGLDHAEDIARNLRRRSILSSCLGSGQRATSSTGRAPAARPRSCSRSLR